MTSLHSLLLPSLALLTFGAANATAQGWPQYNGPQGDRSTTAQVELRSWPEAGPPVLWRRPTKDGFASVSLGGGMLFTLVGEGTKANYREICVALDQETGEERWLTQLSTTEYDGGGGAGTEDNRGGDGPRSTPSYAKGRVYVYDANLGLHCMDAESGELEWTVDVLGDHGGRNVRWQNASSPLVEDDCVYVVGGGAGESLMCFDAESGQMLWSTGDETMTHATPIATTIHDQRQILFYVQSGVVSLRPDDGAELWRIDYQFKISSAASPVVYEDIVYVSAGYGVGAGAFRIGRDGETWTNELLWRKRNKLMNHWSTPVCHEGFLYGMFSFKKYGEGPVKCVDIRTGEESWSESGFGPGNAILAGDLVLALSDAGRVALVEPTTESYRELAGAELISGKCWSTPVFADGKLYLRSTRETVCVSLDSLGR